MKPPRGYEKFFAVEKLQEMAAAGTDPNEATRLAVRAIERGRADIRDVQFAVEDHAAKFEEWLAESGAGHGMSARSRRRRNNSSTVSEPFAVRARPRSPSSNAR